MSNNAAERELRAVAMGRKNWTFAGSDEGCRRAAAIYTLIATAKLNDIYPQAWSPTFSHACRIIRPTASRAAALHLAPENHRRSSCVSERSALRPELAYPVAFTGCIRDDDFLASLIAA
jgi:hypothetical protein